MRFAMCNEFCEGWEIERALELAASSGFSGVEIAPFTLAADVREITPQQRQTIAQQARNRGLEIVGLHWLLVGPPGLYLTHPRREVRKKTADYFRALIQCCADLGGSKLVIGSPKQRNVLPECTPEQAWDYAVEVFSGLLGDAEACAVDLCIEPLARTETDFITSAAEGLRMCREIDHARFRLHLDVKAMSDEGRPLGDIIRESDGWVGHFHANDANRSYPGSGDTDFLPVAQALRDIAYKGWVSVEVFDFSPGPERIASNSYAYLSSAFGG